jgi:hypothetical protein
MAIVKLKTGTTTPAAASLQPGQIAHNTSAGQVHVGNNSNNPVKMVGGIASQTASSVAISGGTVTVPTITATTAKVSQLQWTAGERLYYDEGLSANSFTGNWNYTDTTNMSAWADLGSGYGHGWRGSQSTYQLTLNGLPAHTEVMYECYVHMIDSLDLEGANVVYTSNTAGGDIRQADWYKGWSENPKTINLFNSTTFSWRGNRYYSYTPWSGAYAVSGTSSGGGGQGYAVINTGWYSHTASSFIAKHFLVADQAASNEAYYITHVKLWLRGGTSNAITNIPTSVSYDTSQLPTQAAVKAFIDGNYAQTLKNLYSYTGNTTYTKSGNDVKIIKVICVGGGGGGRGYHESGGAGGYAERIIDAVAVSSISVTVGGGSGGGYYFGFSGQGATTSFGSYCSATGGYGANQNRSHAGGHGGVGSGGQINFYGGGGGGHAPGYNNQQGGEAGQGGGSFFGGTSPGRHGSHGYTNSTAPGAGAFGGAGNHNGGDGSTGICLVYEYK